MASARPKPGKNDSFLKPKVEKQVGERVSDGEKIREALKDYRELLAKLEGENNLGSNGKKKKSGLGVHIRAAKVLKKLGKWVNTTGKTGHVSGVKVGDEFRWRCELSIVGLHHDFQKGIAHMKGFLNGKSYATSIVDSGRHNDVKGNLSKINVEGYDNVGSNPRKTFIYYGEGEKPKDQKLVGGNRALKNSCDDKIPVRVIRKVKRCDGHVFKPHNSNSRAAGSKDNDCGYKFVYDGLYRVTKVSDDQGGVGFWFSEKGLQVLIEEN